MKKRSNYQRSNYLSIWAFLQMSHRIYDSRITGFCRSDIKCDQIKTLQMIIRLNYYTYIKIHKVTQLVLMKHFLPSLSLFHNLILFAGAFKACKCYDACIKTSNIMTMTCKHKTQCSIFALLLSLSDY